MLVLEVVWSSHIKSAIKTNVKKSVRYIILDCPEVERAGKGHERSKEAGGMSSCVYVSISSCRFPRNVLYCGALVNEPH
jgi:hypothetical protein